MSNLRYDSSEKQDKEKEEKVVEGLNLKNRHMSSMVKQLKSIWAEFLCYKFSPY